MSEKDIEKKVSALESESKALWKYLKGDLTSEWQNKIDQRIKALEDDWNKHIESETKIHKEQTERFKQLEKKLSENENDLLELRRLFDLHTCTLSHQTIEKLIKNQENVLRELLAERGIFKKILSCIAQYVPFSHKNVLDSIEREIPKLEEKINLETKICPECGSEMKKDHLAINSFAWYCPKCNEEDVTCPVCKVPMNLSNTLIIQQNPDSSGYDRGYYTCPTCLRTYLKIGGGLSQVDVRDVSELIKDYSEEIEELHKTWSEKYEKQITNFLADLGLWKISLDTLLSIKQLSEKDQLKVLLTTIQSQRQTLEKIENKWQEELSKCQKK